ncbi:phosphatidylserine decarboxylase [Besnoitia besnoiti]|uniref:Phosphatidylserine decarboxylase n=1 Tax=Besnoitia besnoiti TaxID=94643 RepID=A0A2A9MCM3_BESBE|nr:phosphatidylserine decarboxylase [Besnoitia besnoiti]PFH35629.1 phosphatidylserine decarboxylase [Besnoitia besnoiti]
MLEKPLPSMSQIRPVADSVITNELISQVKSRTFRLRQFLFGSIDSELIRLQSPEKRLYVSINHLAPSDYHRVHSPADWTIKLQMYIPGCIPCVPPFQVNRRTLEDGAVLHQYERTSLVGHWDPEKKDAKLFFSVTMVAAIFVGGLNLAWEENPLGSRLKLGLCSGYTDVYEKQVHVPMCASQELGAFRFGSTVVTIFEAPPDFNLTSTGQCSHTSAGQPQGYLGGNRERPLQRTCDAYRGNFKSAFEFLLHIKDKREYDDQLRKNTLLPPEWRREAGRSWAEAVRAMERGLLYGFPLSHYLLQQWAPRLTGYGDIVLGQPGVLRQLNTNEDEAIREGFRCFSRQQLLRAVVL